MSVIKTLFGLDLPKKGKVVGKATDGPRFVVYPDPVGKVWVNKEPIYWLVIKDGKRKPRPVPVSKKEWETHNDGDTWSAAA